MAKHNLTKTFIQAIPPSDKEERYSDAKQAGVVLRCRGNAKTFIFDSTFRGRSIKVTIGRWPDVTVDDAREQARKIRVTMDNGFDPREGVVLRKTVAPIMLRDVWRDYLAEKSGRLTASTLQDIQTAVVSLDTFMDVRLGMIDEGKVLAVFNSIRSQAQANKSLRYVRAVLNWGMVDDRYKNLIPVNPVLILSKKRLWHPTKTRSVVLSKDDLPKFYQAIKTLHPRVFGLMLFLLYTGSRLHECDNMEVDTARGVLTFKGTKNGDDRVIPITTQMARLLDQWHAGVLPSYRPYVKKMQGRLGFDLTPHDVRRSFATLSEWLDIPTGTVMQIMGHRPSGVHESHYRHRPVDLLRGSLQRYHDWLDEQMQK